MAQLTHIRVARFFESMAGSPARFSRAANKLAHLAQVHESKQFWALARACNEQRHMLLALRLGDLTEAARQSVRVGLELRDAVR